MTSKNTEQLKMICNTQLEWSKKVSEECNLYQFAGLNIVTSPYEMFCRYGIELSKVIQEPTLFVGLANGLKGYMPFDETEGIGTRGDEYKSYFIAETFEIPETIDISGMIYRPERLGLLVGQGTRIQEGTVVRGGYTRPTQIGSNVEIMPQVHIGHDVIIGDNTVISPETVVGGYAVIGKNCKIRLNVTIRPGVRIVDNVTVGMGSVVTKDLLRPGVYFGSPARFKKTNIFSILWKGIKKRLT